MAGLPGGGQGPPNGAAPTTFPSVFSTPDAGVKFVVPMESLEGTGGVVQTFIIEGAKDVGKTCGIVDLPLPKDAPRRVLITVDDTCKPSLVQFFGVKRLKELGVEVYNVCAPVPEAGYEGFDPTRPETSVGVVEMTIAALRQFRKDGNVGLLVIDHFQGLFEQIGGLYADTKREELDTSGKDTFIGWRERTKRMNAIEWLARQTPKQSEHGDTYCFVSGYDEDEKGNIEKDSGGKFKSYTRVMKPATWLKRDIRRNWIGAIVMSAVTVSSEDPSKALDVEDVETTTYYRAEIVDSKYKEESHPWRKGRIVDITDVGLKAFLSEKKEDSTAGILLEAGA